MRKQAGASVVVARHRGKSAGLPLRGGEELKR